MAEIAIAGATAALRLGVSVLGNLAVKEGSRLARLQEDIVWIESEMRHIQSYLKDAEAKQWKTEGVSNLVRDIWDLAYDVENIMDTYFPRITSSRKKGLLGGNYLKNARGFAKEVEGIRKRVEDIKTARQAFGINESSRSREEDTWDTRRSFPHIDEPNVVGFEGKIEDLVQKVLDEDIQHRVVSIVGMPGLGKTTLAKKVYNSVRQHFEHSVWICVSLQPNIKELLRDIARQVGLEHEKWEQNAEANLFAFLNRKRYVIVIDDIWRTEVWDALKNGIPTNSENGSRIILTSRFRDVGVHVGGWNSLFELQPLDHENSRKLFFKMIEEAPQNISEIQDSPQLEKIGKLILERCGGVPLAIVLAAGLLILRERSENAWKGVLEGMGQEQDKCSEIFALSYKDLPPYLKPCFLYFGLFPEDHNISVFDLINLWAAEGFIRGSGVREVEDVGDDYLNHLIARNMIQIVERRSNGRVRSCRLHDILQSLCIREAEKINFFSTCGDLVKNNSALKARRLTTTHGSDINDYLSLDYQNSKLRSMLCFNGNQSQKKRFKNLLRGSKFLRVLSFDCNYLFKPLKTGGIGNLRQLTYLKLGSILSGLELPYAITNLVSLQTLDVQNCTNVFLPNVIWSMKQLRHILLPRLCVPPSFGGVILDVFHPIKFSLPNLQTLHGLPGIFFKAEWLHKLTNLRTLRVNYPFRLMEVLSDATIPVSHKLEDLSLNHSYSAALQIYSWNLSQYENLCELCIFNVRMGDQFPQFDKLPPNLTKITLAYTDLKMDPMETLKKLQKLKILMLHTRSYMGEELVCSGEPGNFPQLEVFELDNLDTLKVLVVEEGGMPKVNDLRIVKCKPEIRISDRLKNIVNFTTVLIESEWATQW